MMGLAILVAVIMVMAAVIFVFRRAVRVILCFVVLFLIVGLFFVLIALANRRDRLPFDFPGPIDAFLDVLEEPGAVRGGAG